MTCAGSTCRASRRTCELAHAAKMGQMAEEKARKLAAEAEADARASWPVLSEPETAGSALHCELAQPLCGDARRGEGRDSREPGLETPPWRTAPSPPLVRVAGGF